MAQQRGPDGSVRIAVSGTINTLPWANVFWANLVGGVNAPQADLDLWTANFLQDYVSSFGTIYPAGWIINGASSTLFQPGETALHSAASAGHIGTGADALVENTASSVVLSWTTNVYWRGGKPRTYLAGVPGSHTDDGHSLNTGAVSFYTTQAAAFRNAINGLVNGAITQTQMGFVSFKTGGTSRPVGVFFPTTGVKVHKRLGTQRRRLGPWLP